MTKKIVVVLICLLILTAVLFGCSESYKNTKLSTDFTNLNVSSNGGLAVVVGKYMFYINGYAGNTVSNKFGDVHKGAIARVELDAEGNPIDTTNTVVVPKNVYNEVASSGLYAQGEYIYYTTPSTEKDKAGLAKVGEMHLMRTKIDGTDTSIIKKFSDYSAVYKVVDGYILYVNAGELRQIDLNSKKFNDKLVASSIGAYQFTEYKEGANSFVNNIFFTKASEATLATHNIIWSYKAGTAEPKLVIDGLESYPENVLEHPNGYTLTLVEMVYLQNDQLKLIYTKTDGGSSTLSSGTYSVDIDQNLNFNYVNEERYSFGTTYSYTKFNFLNANNAVAFYNSTLILLTKINNVWTRNTNTLIDKSLTEIVNIETVESKVTVYYIENSILMRMTVLTLEDDGSYTISKKPPETLWTTTFISMWIKYDKVGSRLYFFNSSVADFTYYLDYTKIVADDTVTKAPKLLSLILPSEQLELL